MATGKRRVRGREEIMARCPGSGKRCVPQLLRRFKGLRGDARGEGCSGRMLAATVGRSQTAPGHAGQQVSRWEIDFWFMGAWQNNGLEMEHGWLQGLEGSNRDYGALLSFGRQRHTLCSTLLSTGATLPATHATGRPHAFLAEDQAHWCCSAAARPAGRRRMGAADGTSQRGR